MYQLQCAGVAFHQVDAGDTRIVYLLEEFMQIGATACATPKLQETGDNGTLP